MKGSHVYHDFTDEGIAEVLAEYLNPRFLQFYRFSEKEYKIGNVHRTSPRQNDCRAGEQLGQGGKAQSSQREKQIFVVGVPVRTVCRAGKILNPYFYFTSCS